MIKAVFLDFDWTLYAHDTHEIPASAIDALRRADANGVKVFLATGRSRSEMHEKAATDYKKIPFSGFVTMNGVILLDKDEKIIYGEPFSGAPLELLVKLFKSKKMPIVFATEDSTYINIKTQRVIDAHKAITYIDHRISEYTGEPVYLAVMYISREEEAALAPMLPGIEFKRWCPIGADLIPAGMDKAIGIRRFAEILGIGMDEVMAVGDSLNDIQMLQDVGIGVAMGNAEPEVAAVADYITTGIGEDGVANALKHFGVI